MPHKRKSRLLAFLKRSPHLRTEKRKKIRYVKMPKWRTGTVGKAEIVLFTKERKPLLAMRMQRRSPDDILTSVTSLTKNPDKVIIASIGSFGYKLQVYYYKSNPFTFFIARSGDYVSVPFDLWIWMREVFRRKRPEAEWQRPKRKPGTRAR
jgi:hypothetical protein